jgi:hypothetical protein
MKFHALALLSCFWLATPLPALARAPAPDDGANVETARDEFRRASSLAQAERWSEALELYLSAYERVPRATTLYNVGYCREKLGELAAAYRDTLRALEMSRSDPERGLSPEHRAQAEAALSSMKAQVARLEFSPAPEALEVRVDGAPAGALSTEKERLFFAGENGLESTPALSSGGTLILDAGRRRIEVRSARGVEAVELELSAGTTTTFEWPTLEPPAPVIEPPERAVTPEPVLQLPPPAPEGSPSPGSLRPWGIGSLVLGGTAAALGAGAGLFALSAKKELDKTCSSDGQCPKSQGDTVSHFETSATLANVAFVVAAVSTVAGITLLVVESSSSTSSAKVELRVAPAGRVELGGRF